ncbi:MAG: aldehyde dehydrogenase [Acidobacteria bacterium]|nr:MAG: aldehyde dehydrogenase [Acidobacteriota bacterium]
MERNERNIDVLNDLIKINNDRVEGYQKAITNTGETDIDLRNIFNQMADESRGYLRELTDQVRRLGGEPASGSTAPGKVYRVWMDVKSGLSRSERKSVLEECEYGEDAAQKAYEKALDAENDLSPEVRSLVQREKNNLKASHNTIKSHRDMQRKAKK